MPFFRNIEGCAKSRKLTISKWRMVKYPENIWMNMREYLYELKWKKRKMKIQDYTFLRVGRHLFDFNIAKLCAPSNNCAQKRYFGTMKFRDNVITDALCAYCFFFFFSFLVSLGFYVYPFWIVMGIDGLKNYLAIVTLDARDMWGGLNSQTRVFARLENLVCIMQTPSVYLVFAPDVIRSAHASFAERRSTRTRGGNF